MASHVECLAAVLADEGVRHAFGVLGSGSSFALMEALAERGVSYQPVAHEAEAALMAGACCRDGAVRSVALTIKGPGFANLVPGMVANSYENRPAVTVSEAYPPAAAAALQHKRLDHGALASSAVKALAYAGADGSVAREAIGLARAEVPGPVHVDLAAQPVEREMRSFATPAEGNAGNPLDDILGRISSARRPALVLGSAVARHAQSRDWAVPGIPVATTAAAKGVFDEAHSLAAGVLTGERGELSPESSVLAHADLIVGVGLRNREMVRTAPFDVPLLLVDCIGGDTHEGFGAEMCAVVESLGEACDLLLAALASATRWGADLTEARFAEIDRRLAEGWLPSHVFGSMARHAPDAVTVLDTGLFCIVGEAAWRARSADSFCGSSNGRFMGTGIPTGVGIALAEQRPVIAAVGDGGARPYFGSLGIAADRNLPLLTVVMNDGGFGTIASGKPVARIGHPAIAVPERWVARAESLGLEAHVALTPGHADDAIREWAGDPRPLVLEARFDPKAYVAMVEGLR